MFLKSIDLFGFKSFADKSHIDFTDGIAALIGPNGCGKSNVVDAVKWVLGEQATRSLRAERMDDVIFNGSETRKPLNVADVTLTLENDGVLPMDVPEVTIRRRLFRSGDSEYFVNGAPVKLKDLRELFYDTGIGKSAYSIMEQGKIDQILSNRPEDRRMLFEEAAGITRFKVRGREADRKLERTEQNMREVETVLSEVKKSYETLKKQAEKTSRYRELREEVFRLEVGLQLSRLTQFRKQEEEQTARGVQFEEERRTLKTSIDSLNEKLESELSRVNSMESRLVEVQKRLYGVELEKSSRAERATLIKEQREQLEERIEAEKVRLKALSTRSGNARQEAEAGEKAAHETERQITEVEHGIKGIGERIARGQQRQKDARQGIHEREKKISTIDNEIADIQRELRQVTDELVAALDSRLQESGYSAGERSRAETALQEALEQFHITLEGRAVALQEHVRIQQQSESEPYLNRLDAAFKTLRENLNSIDRAFQTYQNAIPRFLDDFLAPEGTITRKRMLDDTIERLQQESINARGQIQELTKEIQHLQESIEEERVNQEQMKVNRVQLQGRREQQLDSARRHLKEAEDLERQHRELDQRIGSDQERSELLARQFTKMHEELETLQEQEQELQEELKTLEVSIASDNRSLEEEEGRLKKSMQRLAQIQSRIEEVHLRTAEKRTEIRSLFEGFLERHGRDLREFEKETEIPAEDQKQLREQIQRAREALRELGNVNLMAVEEFTEVSDRYEFLNTQITDLRTAREDLVRVTAEIKRESEQLFVDTYNRIRKNFHTVYRRLFGGGRAELRLINPDVVLESGIDILVQPPGKKLESIALLSGGERSMTAVALLFATFMVRPSPFTLLDEIDAALDEHNVGRFVQMLREFSEQSQFIVITHNKKTVAGANTLLGVTMQENGVSQIVTVKLEGEVVAS